MTDTTCDEFRERLATIVDEAFGMQPVMSHGELLTLLGSELSRYHRESVNRILDLQRERDAYKRAKSENDDRFMLERDEARQRAAELGGELGKMRACFPYCDQHKPVGMRVAKCCECDWTKLHHTLSEICYATEEPNEYGYSIYDADPNPDMVLERVKARITDLEAALVVSEREKAELQQRLGNYDWFMNWLQTIFGCTVEQVSQRICTPAERALVEAAVIFGQTNNSCTDQALTEAILEVVVEREAK